MENTCTKDSLLFLQYLISNGFNPENYYGILELFQSANGSLSQYLVDYNQYLLSRKAIYSEMDSKGIDGAFGYLDNTGSILVPKTLLNDDRFLHTPVLSPFRRHSYGVPSIEDFGVIIGHNPDPKKSQEIELFYSLVNNPNTSQYFGVCTDSDGYSYYTVEQYRNTVKHVNSILGAPIYTFEHDTVRSEGKELCLIKRSR